jgi:hypothetical protein
MKKNLAEFLPVILDLYQEKYGKNKLCVEPDTKEGDAIILNCMRMYYFYSLRDC